MLHQQCWFTRARGFRKIAKLGQELGRKDLNCGRREWTRIDKRRGKVDHRGTAHTRGGQNKFEAMRHGGRGREERLGLTLQSWKRTEGRRLNEVARRAPTKHENGVRHW